MNPEQTTIISVKTLHFPEAAKSAFMGYITDHCGNDNPYKNFESKRYALAFKMHELLSGVAKGKAGADAENAQAIIKFAEDIRNNKENPAVLIKNFPMDAMESLLAPPTNPKDFSTAPAEKTGKKGYITEWSLEAFNTLCGLSPTQAMDIQAGNRYQRIIPQKGLEKSKTNSGSEIFPWHTEATYRHNNDMQVMIAGLRNKKTPTVILPIDEVEKIFRKEFTRQELAILEKPIFKFITDSTFNTPDMSCTRAILKCGNDGKFVEMQVNGNLERPHIDENAAKKYGTDINEAQKLIQKVSDIISPINQEIILKHEDLLVFDNLKNLHSRTVIHPDDKVEGRQRHLMRTQSYRDEEVRKRVDKELGGALRQ